MASPCDRPLLKRNAARSGPSPQADASPKPGNAAWDYDVGNMASPKSSTKKIETVEPIGSRVLIRKDEDKKITKVGIHLPDKIEIPTLTGRVVAISAQVANDADYPIKQYDRILFNPKHGIPVDFEGDNRLFVIPIEDVVAVFRKE
jgi:chaperonin GroES